ncbi:MAG: hypothetical protein IM574_09420 [Cytophagales bacterium]|jgi:hypothetical protein|nr:hypothetical protein [Cytophagales bacterium]MCA6391460.1 hypothetical protein [Cytophagales bacterium]MCA6394695.1 hypothetical protein [Cytophagales bacterium]MCA6399128.1 hypothetical protein [Cytophagales bacterium]MCA6401490.1 hypothetical protein [Cytophagales bacterium]
MKFKIFALYLAIFGLTIACATKDRKYSPSDCLPIDKQNQILKQMVRYSNKLAPEATHKTKFNTEFNWYYERAMNESKILYCKKENDIYQMLVSKKARSVTPMEEGIAIKVKLNQKDSLVYYEEVFRMWKMPADSLISRGKYLFDRLVNKEDLTIYYSKFQKDRFIEFPDQRFSFDVSKRRWRDSELDTLRLK